MDLDYFDYCKRLDNFAAEEAAAFAVASFAASQTLVLVVGFA